MPNRNSSYPVMQMKPDPGPGDVCLQNFQTICSFALKAFTDGIRETGGAHLTLEIYFRQVWLAIFIQTNISVLSRMRTKFLWCRTINNSFGWGLGGWGGGNLGEKKRH